MQEIIVGLVVLGALVYLLRPLWRDEKDQTGGCGGGCDRCGERK